MKQVIKALKSFTWRKCVVKALTFSKVGICALTIVTIVTIAHLQNTQTVRKLSIYLGPGRCEWEAPTYDVPEDVNFTKTLIAGYPSGDKRLTFVQMEALTGLSARDEWDFAFLVSSCINLIER